MQSATVRPDLFRPQPTAAVGCDHLIERTPPDPPPHFDKERCGPYGFHPPARLTEEKRPSWGRQRTNARRSYLDAEKRPSYPSIGRPAVRQHRYAQCVGDLESTFELLGVHKIWNLVYLNSERGDRLGRESVQVERASRSLPREPGRGRHPDQPVFHRPLRTHESGRHTMAGTTSHATAGR